MTADEFIKKWRESINHLGLPSVGIHVGWDQIPLDSHVEQLNGKAAWNKIQTFVPPWFSEPKTFQKLSKKEGLDYHQILTEETENGKIEYYRKNGLKESNFCAFANKNETFVLLGDGNHRFFDCLYLAQKEKLDLESYFEKATLDIIYLKDFDSILEPINIWGAKVNDLIIMGKWITELELLQPDILYLKFNNSEFLALSQRYNLGELESYLWKFAKRNYITYMSMAIRRLVDKHKGVSSLWKLINDIEFCSNIVTTQWFLKKWPGGKGETIFTEFFGTGDTLQKNDVIKHKESLERITQTVRDRANQYEAHKDKKPKLKNPPTFQDIDQSVEIITIIYKKYYYLLKQASLTI